MKNSSSGHSWLELRIWLIALYVVDDDDDDDDNDKWCLQNS